ncbi:MAG: ATP-binding protein [Planctomycetota bacterium]
MGRETETRLRLKPADSFDLIRLLARSQHDPRKAVCELVQNSLDAGAKHVEIAWLARRGQRVLSVRDDGGGIFPAISRDEALRHIATTIGHSHKRALTPVQRRELMALGKYGIGLLGFWAVGHEMHIHSRVGGGDTWTLTLIEDLPDAHLTRRRVRRLDASETFTEIEIIGVHEEVQRQVRPARLHSYLAGELRGQLLARDVEIRILDRSARGRARKELTVRAERFRGQPLPELRRLRVAGHDDAAVELYLVSGDDDRRGTVTLACGGTTVLDDIAAIESAEHPRAPWDTGRFEGVIDFAALQVPPGTRRGIVFDATARALVEALPMIEMRLTAALVDDEERRRAELDRTLARHIKRAFRRIPNLLPEYDLFDVRGDGTNANDSGSADGRGAVAGAALGAESSPLPDGTPAPGAGEDDDEGAAAAPTNEDDASDGFLFAPGPLAEVRLSPARSRVPQGATRTITARATDEQRRPVDDVELAWSVEGPGTLEADGPRARYRAPEHIAQATVRVVATQGDQRCTAEAALQITDDVPLTGQDVGIPDPLPLHLPLEPWRSRIRERAWEYNTGHPDYLSAAASESRRLRYLLHLFAKEVVLRNFGRIGDGPLLERMVQVLTHLEGRTTARGDGGAGDGSAGDDGAPPDHAAAGSA